MSALFSRSHPPDGITTGAKLRGPQRSEGHASFSIRVTRRPTSGSLSPRRRCLMPRGSRRSSGAVSHTAHRGARTALEDARLVRLVEDLAKKSCPSCARFASMNGWRVR
jgi:hypothetical protein